jgi:hypothetical protein
MGEVEMLTLPLNKIFKGDKIMGFIQRLSQFRTSVSTYTNLPITGNIKNDLRIVTDTGLPYMWIGNEGVDSYTKLLLHFDNNVIDSESTPKTVTNNNVTFSDSIKKFGSHAAIFNGTSAYLTVPDSDDFNLSNVNFTIDLWVRFNTLFGLDGYQMFITQKIDNNNFMRFYKERSDKLVIEVVTNGVITTQITTQSNSLNINQWYHIAFVRSGSTPYIFIDGVSQPLFIIYPFGTFGNYNDVLYIGVDFNGTTSFIDGKIDELRISKGVARWTSNFTPPSSPYSAGSLTDWQKVTSSDYNDLSGIPTSSGLAIDNAVNIVTDLSVNIAILAFQQIASLGGSIVKMFDGMLNQFALNQDGVDLAKCSNQLWHDDYGQYGSDSWYSPDGAVNMTLQSIGYVSNYVPTSARIVIFEDDVDVITENTDLIAYVSRNGGTTFTAVTITKDSSYGDGNLNIFTGSLDLTSQPQGELIVWKLVTQNNKDCKIRGIALNWK